ncbi:hypothetical protein BY996DRAFT_3918663 [Phakopsora pachyrhizi]|nr:hypothetical protein BY996DRAFT_3918663 [Phakopsora pachyrhizi]
MIRTHSNLIRTCFLPVLPPLPSNSLTLSRLVSPPTPPPPPPQEKKNFYVVHVLAHFHSHSISTSQSHPHPHSLILHQSNQTLPYNPTKLAEVEKSRLTSGRSLNLPRSGRQLPLVHLKASTLLIITQSLLIPLILLLPLIAKTRTVPKAVLITLRIINSVLRSISTLLLPLQLFRL